MPQFSGVREINTRCNPWISAGMRIGSDSSTRVDPAEGCVWLGVGCQCGPKIEGFELGATHPPSQPASPILSFSSPL